MGRLSRVAGVVALAGALAAVDAASLEVPLDHADPASGSFRLSYAIDGELDPARPSVFVIQDALHALGTTDDAPIGETLATRLNVVRLTGRGGAEQALAAVGDPIDWQRARRIFGSRQWVEDIDAVRRHLLGPGGRISLFGSSGGGLLLHEYLSVHGDHVLRAFSERAPLPQLDRDLGLNADRFWEEIGRRDPKLRDKMRKVLEARNARRVEVLTLFERQRVFLPTRRLPEARARLVESLAARDRERVREYERFYDVAGMRALLDAPTGVPVRLRSCELVTPLLDRLARKGSSVQPLLEVRRHVAAPLLDSLPADDLPRSEIDLAALRDLSTEVFLLAARWDPTADYRAQIALAAHFREGRLLIADTDHTLYPLDESGWRAELVAAFLLHGGDSPELAAVLREGEPLRWVED